VVPCAVEIQKELEASNAELPENRTMDFRSPEGSGRHGKHLHLGGRSGGNQG
jgi:hypothetical protein